MKPIRLRKELPFVEWPREIRRRWDAAFAKGDDFLDDGGPGAHLAHRQAAPRSSRLAVVSCAILSSKAVNSIARRRRSRLMPRC